MIRLPFSVSLCLLTVATARAAAAVPAAGPPSTAPDGQRPAHVLRAGPQLFDVAVSPDDKLIGCDLGESKIGVWDVRSGRPAGKLDADPLTICLAHLYPVTGPK